MYPHERSLVKKMEGKPFALLGVNSDQDRNALKEVLDKEEITWRSFWNGGTNGPISSAWKIRGWPSLFLIDHKGIIRKQWLGAPQGAELDRSVEILVRLAERDKSRPTAQGNTTPGSSAVDPEVARLSNELVNASAASREDVLHKLRDSKGAQYTDALAHAIHKLNGPAQEQAREALADRLTRLTPKTLTDKLQDEDTEVRRAAALAVARKDDRTHVPRLIELLGDRETTVGQAAHAALKQLSGTDLGTGAEAIPKWKEWWKENEKK
jgi:HEAT repeat protein